MSFNLSTITSSKQKIWMTHFNNELASDFYGNKVLQRRSRLEKKKSDENEVDVHFMMTFRVEFQ